MEKEKKRRIKVLIAMAAVLLAVIFGFDFSAQLRAQLEQSEAQDLEQMARYHKNALLVKLEEQQRLLNLVSDNLDHLRTDTNELRSGFLQSIATAGSFTNVGLIDTNGNMLVGSGEKLDISDREYFQKALQGEQVIAAPLISKITGQPCWVIAHPVLDKGEIVGVVQGSCDLKTASEALLKQLDIEDNSTVVVNEKGLVLLSNLRSLREHPADSLFDFLKKREMEQGLNLNQVRWAMERGESGTFVYAEEEVRHYVSFSPVGEAGWYSFEILTGHQLTASENAFGIIALLLLLKVVVLISLLFFVIQYFWTRTQKQNQIRVQKERERFLELLSHIKGGIMQLRYGKRMEDDRVMYINHEFEVMTGYSLKDLQGLFCRNGFYKLIHPDDAPHRIRQHCRELENGQFYQQEYRLKCKSGNYIWVMDSGYRYEEDGWVQNQILFSNVSVLKAQEENLRLSKESLRIAANLANGCMFEYDLKSKTYFMLENPVRIFGEEGNDFLTNWTEGALEEHIGQEEQVERLVRFYHPEDRARATEAHKRLVEEGQAEFEARTMVCGQYQWHRLHLVLLYNDEHQPERVVGHIVDIDEARSKMEELRVEARHDFLTGIYNRSAFRHDVEQILLKEPDRMHAFFLLDVDNFKGINDSLGHGFGDQVLIDTAKQLSESFRSSDVVARIGGDEFVVFMSDVRKVEAASRKAADICAIYRQNGLGEKDYKISCSVGIALYHPDIGEDYATLYRQADEALYQSKENGKDQFSVYQ